MAIFRTFAGPGASDGAIECAKDQAETMKISMRLCRYGNFQDRCLARHSFGAFYTFFSSRADSLDQATMKKQDATTDILTVSSTF